MSIDITMPRLSDTMEAGTIIKWNVSQGDEVSSGDVVADVETDKATMELAVYDDGTIAEIIVSEGQQVDVGTVIAVMAEEGEDPGSVSAGGGGASAASANGAGDDGGGGGATVTATKPDARSGTDRRSGDERRDGGDRLRVSPVARRLAEEHGLDLHALQGSGPNGRIIKRDVLKAVETAGETRAAVPPSARRVEPTSGGADGGGQVREIVSEEGGGRAMVPVTPVSSGGGADAEAPHLGAGRVPLSSMRQTIARRLVESKQSIPHYQVSMSYDMGPLMALRKDLNAQLAPVGIKLSVNDFLVRACGLAMHEHPDFNASFDGDAVVYHGAVNVGMAISLPAERGGGLVVGVIRNADQKSLRVISAEAKSLAEKARTRGLSMEEMDGSTFTISNLGMFGVDHFTAIINPPNSAILAVGGAIEQPVVKDGEIVVGHRMTATLSNDHRVIDGAMAARYLQTLGSLLANPSTLLV